MHTSIGHEACAAGARQSKACEVLGISSRTLQRWCEDGQVKADGRGKPDTRSKPHKKLSPLEQQRILDIANSQEFAHLSPNQIVPMLADQGQYIASESSKLDIMSGILNIWKKISQKG